MKQNGDPSVEEILASIKQVIARDNRSPSFDPPRREALAQPELAAAPVATECELEDVLDLADSDRVDPESSLLAEDTRSAMRESLAALAAISGPGAVPQIVRSGETSLEGMTRELLRPALAAWLDTNLPPLVERLVAAEIARIVGKKV